MSVYSRTPFKAINNFKFLLSAKSKALGYLFLFCGFLPEAQAELSLVLYDTKENIQFSH